MYTIRKRVSIMMIIIIVFTCGIIGVKLSERFSCKAGTYTLNYNDTIYDVVNTFCAGNKQNAVTYIMRVNNINDASNIPAFTQVQVVATK